VIDERAATRGPRRDEGLRGLEGADGVVGELAAAQRGAAGDVRVGLVTADRGGDLGSSGS
jgi:hypothetical protein